MVITTMPQHRTPNSSRETWVYGHRGALSGEDREEVVFKGPHPKQNLHTDRGSTKTNGRQNQAGIQRAREALQAGDASQVPKQPADLKLCQRIMQARTERKLTQKALAQAVGTRVNDITMIEAGKQVPKGEMLNKMSRVLGVKLSGKTISTKTRRGT